MGTRLSAMMLLLLAVAGGCAPSRQPPLDPGDTVARVDLDRYVGRWYEIARIPNGFQRTCAGDVTADYAARADGRIDVVNRCREADGRTAEIRGVARVVDPGSRARLEVSFVNLWGLRLFWGDYWVLDLDDDYRFAAVGTPDRRYAWILSRTRTLPDADVDRLLLGLETLGYDPAAFEMTAQEAGGKPSAPG